MKEGETILRRATLEDPLLAAANSLYSSVSIGNLDTLSYGVLFGGVIQAKQISAHLSTIQILDADTENRSGHLLVCCADRIPGLPGSTILFVLRDDAPVIFGVTERPVDSLGHALALCERLDPTPERLGTLGSFVLDNF